MYDSEDVNRLIESRLVEVPLSFYNIDELIQLGVHLHLQELCATMKAQSEILSDVYLELRKLNKPKVESTEVIQGRQVITDGYGNIISDSDHDIPSAIPKPARGRPKRQPATDVLKDLADND